MIIGGGVLVAQVANAGPSPVSHEISRLRDLAESHHDQAVMQLQALLHRIPDAATAID